MERDVNGSCGSQDTNERVVSSEAIQLWPYIRTIVEQINAAPQQPTFEKQAEAIQNVFLNAATVVRNDRQVETVGDLKKELQRELWCYKREAFTIVNSRRKLANPNSKLKETTLKQYRSLIKHWPKKRAKLKSEIKALIGQIRAYERPRMIDYSGRLRVIHGGQYPAKLSIISDDGWGGSQWLKIR